MCDYTNTPPHIHQEFVIGLLMLISCDALSPIQHAMLVVNLHSHVPSNYYMCFCKADYVKYYFCKTMFDLILAFLHCVNQI